MRDPLQDTHKPLRRSDLNCQDVDDEVLIYDEQRCATFRLNATAGFIWRCCDGAQDGGSIVQTLTEAWDVSPERACDDVSAALAELSRENLIGWVRESCV